MKNATIKNTTAPTAVTTTSNAHAQTKSSPSIKLDSLKAKVSVSTGSVKSKSLVVDYSPVLSLEGSTEDDSTLVAHDRAHYVAEFKRGVEKSARATLETARVVYEASRMLDSYQFQNFCKEIGYRDNSSSIRKFIAIGKVYPRFIQYAANTYWHWSGRSSAWWGSWLLGLLTALWEECGAVVGESGCHLLPALDPKIP